MVVPDTIFEVASDPWEPPDDDEIHERRIQTTHSTQGVTASRALQRTALARRRWTRDRWTNQSGDVRDSKGSVIDCA